MRTSVRRSPATAWCSGPGAVSCTSPASSSGAWRARLDAPPRTRSIAPLRVSGSSQPTVPPPVPPRRRVAARPAPHREIDVFRDLLRPAGVAEDAARQAVSQGRRPIIEPGERFHVPIRDALDEFRPDLVPLRAGFGRLLQLSPEP